jgi:sigma-B regulation protein RsbQ
MSTVAVKVIIGTIFFLAAFISCGENKETKKTETMKKLIRDGAEINYAVEGNGDTTLFFVHGSYIDQTYWKEQVAYFKNNYTVITLDLPGQGKSGKDRQDWSIEGFAKDVNYVIEQLDLKNVVLIGHSIGGDINLIAATSAPEPLAGFIAVDCFKNAATPLPKQYQQQVKTILSDLKSDFEDTNEQYARKTLLTKETPAAVDERVISDYRHAYKPMGLKIMPEVFKMYETEKRLLPALTYKLYIINVDYMPINEVPLRQYAKNGYEVFHMKGTSHFPMIESPQKLNKILEECLKSIANDNKEMKKEKAYVLR